MRRLFGANVEPVCGYYKNGTATKNGDKIMCLRKGMVDPGFKCRRFKYDPLKRVPTNQAELPEFTESDFEL